MFDFWVWELWVAFIKLKILIYIYYKTEASGQYLTFLRVLTFLHINIIKKKISFFPHQIQIIKPDTS